MEGLDVKAIRGEIPTNWEKTDSNFLTIRGDKGGEITVAKKHLVAIKEITPGLEDY